MSVLIISIEGDVLYKNTAPESSGIETRAYYSVRPKGPRAKASAYRSSTQGVPTE